MFTSLTPAVCQWGSFGGSSVTFLASGTCTIAANQAGNAFYNAAPQATAGTFPWRRRYLHRRISSSATTTTAVRAVCRDAIAQANAAPGPNAISFFGVTGYDYVDVTNQDFRTAAHHGSGRRSADDQRRQYHSNLQYPLRATPRVLSLEPAPDYLVSISGLRLANANANFADSYGGAIYTGHSLSKLDSIVIQNSIARRRRRCRGAPVSGAIADHYQFEVLR